MFGVVARFVLENGDIPAEDAAALEALRVAHD
jgi:hypothetical protein